MKKYIDTAFGYAIAALAAGVFYREFTKWNGFSGITALGKVHTHLFLLGMVIFLLAALFCTQKDLPKLKTFRAVFLQLCRIMKTIQPELPRTAVVLRLCDVLCTHKTRLQLMYTDVHQLKMVQMVS